MPQYYLIQNIAQISHADNSDLFIILIPIIFVGLISISIYLFLQFAKKSRFNQQVKRSVSAVLFEVRMPKSSDVDAQAADQMYSSLTSIALAPKHFWQRLFYTPNYVSFEVVALPESIRYYISVPEKISELIEKQIHAAYPEADVKRADEYNIISDTSFVEFAGLKLDAQAYKPIRTYSQLHVDTMNAITSSMSRMTEGEGSALQVVITPAAKKWRKMGRDFVSKVRNPSTDSGSSSDDEKKKDKPKPKKVDDEGVGETEKKIMKSAFHVDIRIVAAAKSKDIAKMHLDNILASFDQMELQGSNKFSKIKFKNERQKQEFLQDFIFRNPRGKSILNTEEIATVFHFPNKNVQTPYIHWLLSKRSPAAEEVASTPPGIFLGTATYRGVDKPVFIRPEDRRRHMYIVGKTGSGKSYALQSMIIQDIYNGEGVCFLDPHGDAAEWVLSRIPPERADDVIYFNPADTERPLGFNMIEAYNEEDKHRVANAFIGLLYKMFDPNKQGIVGPRLERAVRAAILTAMAIPGTTLIEVARILYDYNLVKKVFLPKVTDILVREYWEKEIAQTNEYHKSEILGYITSKFDRFITNRMMRNILGQTTSGFNMREVMDKQKILIVNLSKGLIGEENAQFLGLLLIPKILSTAMSRADIKDQNARKDFYLYVDEFQNFASEEFAQILSEARKYRLNLTVGNQYIAQMDEKIKDAVFGNIGTIMSFKVGVSDAGYLQNEFSPVFTQNDLINLENTNAYIKMLVNGEYPPAFSMNTRYKDGPSGAQIFGKDYPVNERVFAMIKELSRYKYGRDEKVVEQEIIERSKGA